MTGNVHIMNWLFAAVRTLFKQYLDLVMICLTRTRVCSHLCLHCCAAVQLVGWIELHVVFWFILQITQILTDQKVWVCVFIFELRTIYVYLLYKECACACVLCCVVLCVCVCMWTWILVFSSWLSVYLPACLPACVRACVRARKVASLGPVLGVSVA